jgi:hypothetical protein
MKLLAALLLVPSIALANSWSQQNQNGGEIVIADRACVVQGKDYGPLKQAYSYWNGGFMEGCWLIQDGMVKIIWKTTWNDGVETRMYTIESFTPKTKSSKQQPRS